jgi:hypothetical protein
MMTMRRVVVAPHLRKEVFLMALALLIEIELRVKGAAQTIIYSGIMSPLVRLNIHCPINTLRSNNNMVMVQHNLIVLKINKVEVQIMLNQIQRQHLIRI